MQQFDVKRGSRKCCVTEQPFGPGEVFYSALFETSSGAIRSDFSSEAWKNSPWGQTENKQTQEDVQTTPTENRNAKDLEEQTLIGWWKQRVPNLDTGKVYWAPDHVLIAWFDSLYARQSESNILDQETTWVMALLMMQKRLLTRSDQDAEGEILYLINKKTRQQYELHEPQINKERIDGIQNQLAENLFSDRPVTEED